MIAERRDGQCCTICLNMSPENVASTEPQPAGMSELSRIAGVFFEPSKTFRDIAQRPTWLVPMILIVLASLGFAYTLSQRVGWERVIQQQNEAASSRLQQMSPEQREQGLAMQRKILPVSFFGGALLAPPMMSVVVAAVLLGMTALMSAGLRFKNVFAAVAWAGLPRMLSAILTIVVLFLKNPDEFNLRNPLAFNLGAFMDPNGGSKFVYALATSLDLFSIWNMLLLATGLKAAAGKKLTFTGALVAVLVPWGILTLCGAAFAAAFS